MRVEHCRSCKARIVWAKTSPGAQFMPLDADPNPAGNAEVVNSDEVSSAYAVPVVVVHAEPPLFAEGAVHMPHFATCPQGAEWSGSHR